MATRKSFWRFAPGTASAVLLLAEGGSAQITPDQTLGVESSVVVPNVEVRGGLGDRINGGAIRGENLFHSFEDFNVETDGRVYFSNPAEIENILGRVTGENLSNIDGTLGVDGDASLYLINPNGVVFGPNARLDVSGAFAASTADGLEFSDGQVFSARDPEAPPLVEVNIPIGMQFGTDAPAALRNEAELEAGADLALSGGEVVSEGALVAPAGEVRVESVAGNVAVQAVEAQSAVLAAAEDLVLEESNLRTQEDLSLLAERTVRVRDSEEQAFLAAAGGDLLVQGDEAVDILALEHLATTPFQSGGELTLVSEGNVSADSHFSSFGNFSIETLEGDPADFFSLYDPIILSNSDVIFGNYTGTALKIETAKGIRGGNIKITGPDTTGIPVDDPDHNALTTTPAAIFRAGLSNAIKSNLSQTLGGTTFEEDPAPLERTGSISLNSIDTRIHVDDDNDPKTPSNDDDNIPGEDRRIRGPVILSSDSPIGDIIVAAGVNNSFSILASNLSIDTKGDISITGSTTVRQDGPDTAGDITIGSRLRPSSITAGRFSARNGGKGDGGNITISTQGVLTVTGGFDRSIVNPRPATLNYDESQHEGFAGIATQANRDGGSIKITADNGIIVPAEIVSASDPVDSSDTADGGGGEIELRTINGPIKVGNIRSFGKTAGGNICAIAGIINGSACGSPLQEGVGVGGELSFLQPGNAFIDVGDIISEIQESDPENNPNGSSGHVLLEARDNITTGSINTKSVGGLIFDTSGDIDIISRSGEIDTTGGELNSSTETGDAGDVRLRAKGKIETGNIFSGSKSGPAGNSGTSDEIIVRSKTKIILDKVRYETSTLGSGFSGLGDITVESPKIEITSSTFKTDTFNSAVSGSETGADAGDINIGTNISNDLSIENNSVFIGGSRLSTATHGNHDGKLSTPGNAGKITIGGINSNTVTIGNKDSNGMTLESSSIASKTHANLILSRNVDEEITNYTEYSQDISYGAGNGGSIEIQGQVVTLEGGSKLVSSTYGSGVGGDILIDANEIKIQSEAGVISETSGAAESATAGDIFIGSIDTSGQLTSDFSGSIIEISSSKISTATGITTENLDGQAVQNSDNEFDFTPGISLDPEFGLANAGEILIGGLATSKVSISNSSTVQADTSGPGDSRSIKIISGQMDENMEATEVLIQDSNITASAVRTTAGISDDPVTGNSGEVIVNSEGKLVVNNSLIQNKVADTLDLDTVGGSVNLEAKTIEIKNSSRISADTSGSRHAGSIQLITEQVNNVSATPELLIEQSKITAATSDSGNAGSIKLVSTGGNIEVNQSSQLSSSTSGIGNGKGVEIEGKALSITNGSVVQAESLGSGSPGSISVSIADSVDISGSNDLGVVSELSTFSDVDADLSRTTIDDCVGCIDITSESLILEERGRISAATFSSDTGESGGDINIKVTDLSIAPQDPNANLQESGGGQITTSSRFRGTAIEPGANAGDINIDISGKLMIGGSAPSLQTLEDVILLNPIGNVQIQASSLGNSIEQILVSNGIGSLDIISNDSMMNDFESLIGLEEGSFSTSRATQGSAVIFDLKNAQSNLSIRWNFLTNENTPDELFNDFIFFSDNENKPFQRIANTEVNLLKSENLTFKALTAGSEFKKETGVQEEPIVFKEGLGLIGVVDVEDKGVDSGVRLTQITTNSRILIKDRLSQFSNKSESEKSLSSGIFAESYSAKSGEINLNFLSNSEAEITLNDGAEISNSTKFGDGADINFTGVRSLALNGDAKISTDTDGGAAGSVTVNKGEEKAANSVTLTGSGSISVSATEQIDEQGAVIRNGNAGEILLNAKKVTLTGAGPTEEENAKISATTTGGTAQGITLENLQTLDVTQAFITASTDTGAAGQILLNQASDSSPNPNAAQKVTLTDATLSVLASESKGQSGDIAIAAKEVEVTSSNINASNKDNKVNPGDIIFSQVDKLTASDSNIEAKTEGGKAGSVTVNQGEKDSADSVTLTGKSSISVSATELTDDDEKVISNGDAGEILLNAKKVTLTGAGPTEEENAKISATTTGGTAQGITLENLQTLDVTQAFITASTDTGAAGQILINQASDNNPNPNAAQKVTLTDATLSVLASKSKGQSGDIAIAAQEVEATSSNINASNKDDKVNPGDIIFSQVDKLTASDSKIEAKTAGGKAGSVTVNQGEKDSADSVTLTGKSSISVSATESNGTAGNAGEILLNAKKVTLTGAGSTEEENAKISATTTGGTAQGITLENLQTLDVTQAFITASTKTGKAGQISLNQANDSNPNPNAAQKVTLTDSTLSVVASESKGQSGDIAIAAQEVEVTSSNINASNKDDKVNPGDIIFSQVDKLTASDSKIEAKTAGGKAGSVTVNQGEKDSADSVTLTGKSSISVSATESNGTAGNAGEILLNAKKVTLTGAGPTEEENAKISATTTGGTAQGITLENLQTLDVTQAFITASTKTGKAGSIEITNGEGALTEVVLDKGQIAARAEDENGKSGGILINAKKIEATDSLISASNIDDDSDLGAIKLSKLTELDADSSLITTSTESGIAGDIKIESESGVETSISLTGKLTGFDLNRDGRISEEDKNGGVIAEASKGGKAGNITLDSTSLDVEAGAEITAQSQGGDGEGNSGEIEITAQSVTLNEGEINAQTDAGTGESIKLNNVDSLTVEEGSSIVASTKSGEAGSIEITNGDGALTGVVLDKGQIAARAEEGGKSGGIVINAKRIEATDSLITASNVSDGRDLGAIKLSKLTELDVDGSLITTSTESGKAGDIEIESEPGVETKIGLNGKLTSFDLNGDGEIQENEKFNQGGIVAEATGEKGSAGDISLESDTITVEKQSAIIASTNSGKAGSITIENEGRALKEVVLDEGAIATRATGNDGDAGSISIQTEKLKATNSLISASNIDSNDSSSVALSGLNELDANGSLITTSTKEGTAGNITIESQPDTESRINLNSKLTSFDLNGDEKIGDDETFGQGGIIAEATMEGGTGNAGSIILTGTTLNVRSGAEITAQSQGGKNTTSGEIDITAQSVSLNNAEINAETNQGEGGNIKLSDVDSLRIEERSSIIASTKSGEAGNIEITNGDEALTEIWLDKGQIAARAREEDGKSGGILINARKIEATDSLISASNVSDARDLGEIKLSKLVDLDVTNSLVTTSTESGTAGDIKIEPESGVEGSIDLTGKLTSLDLDRNGQISQDEEFNQGGIIAEASAGGNAGNIQLKTATLNVSNEAEITAKADGPLDSTGQAGTLDITAQEILLNNALISTTNKNSFQVPGIDTNGDGENTPDETTAIRLKGVNNLESTNSLITSSTEGGFAGGIEIDAQQQVLLSGVSNRDDSVRINPRTNRQARLGGIVASANAPAGTAGNVNINAGQLTVEQQARVEVSNPEGQAGNLSVNIKNPTDQLNIILDDGQLLAETGPGERTGAEITLDMPEYLLLKNDSRISAIAFDRTEDDGTITQANGGNITINTAVPIGLISGPNGSDIIATAESGDGGNITIDASGVLGFGFQRSRDGNRTNDIDASSGSGNDGTVRVTNIGNDPSREVTDLPSNFVDVSEQIARSCADTLTPAEQEQGEFAIAGRGGLPASPTALLRAEDPGTDWVSLTPQFSETAHSSGSKAEFLEEEEKDTLATESESKVACREIIQSAQATTVQ